MINKIINFNSKSLMALLLCFIMLFSVLAPTAMAASEMNEENPELDQKIEEYKKQIAAEEAEKGITGNVLDFSSFDFSKQSSYGNLESDHYNIKRVTSAEFSKYDYVPTTSHEYVITLKNLTAKKIILPPDDADKDGKSMVDEEGKPYTIPSYSGKPRENHITIILEGDNKVTGYGIEGYPVKGIKIEGSGNLTINAYSEPKAQRVRTQKADGTWVTTAELTRYTKAGISVETGNQKSEDKDKLPYSPESSLVFAGTGNITIKAPNYHGIINNGDIKFKSGNIKIDAEKTAISAYRIYVDSKNDEKFGFELTGKDRAFYDKPTFQSGDYTIFASKSADAESADIKTSQEIENNYKSYRYVNAKHVENDKKAPEFDKSTIESGKTYCSLPVVTVTDETAIDTITVNGVKVTSGYKTNTAKKKSFTVPALYSNQKKIEVKDIFGNSAEISFIANEFHTLGEPEEKDKEEPTCTKKGSHLNVYKCTVCKEIVKSQRVADPALGHKFKDWETNGNIKKRECEVCKYTETEELTKNISNATVSLSNSVYTYDGTRKEPTVTVSDGSKKLTQGKDYTVAYNNNLLAGTANVKVMGINNYKNAVSKNFTIAKANNTITASNFTKSYSTQAQSFNIGARQVGNAKLTYSSNNSNITVNASGAVTIKAGYAGSATITITAPATSEYNAASKVITVSTSRVNNVVTASNITKSYSTQAQIFSIGARQIGNAKLTYKSNNSNITVNANGVVTIKAGYMGSATITITAPATSAYNQATKTITISTTKVNNSVTASNITRSYSLNAQSFSIGARQVGNAKLTYKSNNSNITVNANGVVTIKAGYMGSATITITAPATSAYNQASKAIVISTTKVNNSVTASNFTKNYSAKAQSFNIGAKQAGNAKLTYKSNNKSVTVNSSGKVTIKAKFIGKATITITAPATAGYNAATKQITITVNPPKINISKLTNSSSKKMTVKWGKNTALTGYQIQYSTNKNFKSGVKTVTVKKASTASTTISKLTKKKTYYVRIRGYKTVSGANLYSAWSSVKSIKIKK